jgi:hypothetical protein
MLDHGQVLRDAHTTRAVVDLPPGHIRRDTHDGRAGGVHPASDYVTVDTQAPNVAGTPLPPGHKAIAAHDADAGGDLPTTKHAATSKEAPSSAVPSTPGQSVRDTHSGTAGGDLADAVLLVLADALDDLERVRIATENRVRSLGQVKGLEGTREQERMQVIADGIADLEHKAELDLKRAMRAHPLGPWVKRTVGLGEKQAARLIAAVGDPADRANPAKLWQYCGHGDPARSRRRKGELLEHNPTAKMRTFLCAEACMKQRHSPFRAVYDAGREKYADAVHTEPCPRCGPKGKPAPVGSPLSDGHKHARALRLVGKAILLDLWREARTIARTTPTARASVSAPETFPPANEPATPMLAAPGGSTSPTTKPAATPSHDPLSANTYNGNGAA